MPDISGFSVIWGLLSFLLVIGLLLATLFLLKRFGPLLSRKDGRNIRVIESCELGSRQRIVLVDVNGEKLLLGIGQDQVTLLFRLPNARGPSDSTEINN
ncbi:MAG: flagellar biosynthetic protein FliO [Pseudomonadota bacterium]|nr:flagellar biosynthetic protein FliO [Pseudomonadota bacterium]